MPHEYYVNEIVFRMETDTRDVEFLDLQGEWVYDDRVQDLSDGRFDDGIAWISDTMAKDIRGYVKALTTTEEYSGFAKWVEEQNNGDPVPVTFERVGPGKFEIFGYAELEEESNIPEGLEEHAVSPLDSSIEDLAKTEGGWDDNLEEKPDTIRVITRD